MNAKYTKSSHTVQIPCSQIRAQIETYPEHAPKLRAMGYRALPIDDNNKDCRIPGWQKLNDHQIVEMQSSGKYLYIDDEGEPNGLKELNKCYTGIRCGDDGLLALDFDFRDNNMSAIAMSVLKKHLNLLADPGTLVVREGLSPKFLSLVRLPEDQTRGKGTVQFIHTDSDEMTNQVLELLCKSSYFVAEGIHPKTQNPYRYLTEATFTNTPIDTLPKVTWEWVDGMVAELAQEFTNLGYTRRDTGTMRTGTQQWSNQHSDDDDLQELLDNPLKSVTGFENTTLEELREIYEHEDFSELHYSDLGVRCFEICHSVSREQAFRDFIFNKTYSPSAANETNRDADEVRKRIDGYFDRSGGYMGNKRTLASAIKRRNVHKEKVQRDKATTTIESFIEQFNGAESIGALNIICDDVKGHPELNDSQRWLLCDPLTKAFKRSGLTAPSKGERQKLLLSGETTETVGVDAIGQIIEYFDETGQYFMDQTGAPYVSLVIEGKRRAYKNESTELRRLIVWEVERRGLKMPKYDRETVYERVDTRASKSGDVRPSAKRHFTSSDGKTHYEHLCDDEDTVIVSELGKTPRIVKDDEPLPCVFVRGHDSKAHAPFEYVDPSELSDRLDEILSWCPPTFPEVLHNALLGSIINARNTLTPDPPMEFIGDHDSGKSSLSEIPVALIDDQMVKQATQSDDLRTLTTNLVGNFVTIEQNAKPYSAKQQDRLCVAADRGSVKEYVMRQNSDQQASHDVSGQFITTALAPVLITDDLKDRKATFELVGNLKTYQGKADVDDLRREFNKSLPQMQNTIRALNAEVMRILADESQPLSGKGHRWPSYARVCNAVARLRQKDWTYAGMVGAGREIALDRMALEDVLTQELELLLQREYLPSWVGTYGALVSELDRLFKGTMSAQLKRRAEDGNYPNGPSRMSRRINDAKYLELINRQGISIVVHSKSQGNKTIQISKIDIASATAEHDIDQARRGESLASPSDFEDLDEAVMAQDRAASDLFYSQELRKEYPLDWLHKYSPWKLNKLPLYEVMYLYLDGPIG